MISEDMKVKMRERYKNHHPLLFLRSCEYASSPGDLFDILETVPAAPFSWDKKRRRWVVLEDLTQVIFPVE